MLSSRPGQNIPAQFIEIMRNHDETSAILRGSLSMRVVTFATAVKLRALRDEMREYRRNAERLLRWNTDKGKQQ